jgi:hypothetical protein
MYNTPKMSITLKFLTRKEKRPIKKLIDSLEGLNKDKIK